MLSPELNQFAYKVATSVAIGAVVGAVLWPFRRAHKEWTSLKTNIEATHKELVQQRTNCLVTLQSQGATQIELLGKTVEALDGVRLDLAEQTGYLKASTAVFPRRRRIAAAKK